MHVNDTVQATCSHFRHGDAMSQARDCISMCAYEDASLQLKGGREWRLIRGIRWEQDCCSLSDGNSNIRLKHQPEGCLFDFKETCRHVEVSQPWISSISSRDERVSEHAPVLAASRIETLQQATT
jgi:hypothetical protein